MMSTGGAVSFGKRRFFLGGPGGRGMGWVKMHLVRLDEGKVVEGTWNIQYPWFFSSPLLASASHEVEGGVPI